MEIEFKPKLRGKLHRLAFYFSIILGVVLVFLAQTDLSRMAAIIYFSSQILLYGVSSMYHIGDWHKYDRLINQLDHISIFILIAGTQSAACLTVLPYHNYWVNVGLVLTWTVAALGIVKVILWFDAPRYLNVALYSFHGMCTAPIMVDVMEHMKFRDVMLFVLGGIIYLYGGIVYARKKPDPYPATFGYHEVFHACTILANMCFMIPIVDVILFGHQ